MIAAIALAPYLRNLNLKLLRDGGLLGLIYFSECLLALVGLETISANRSAFLVSLNVILVPILVQDWGGGCLQSLWRRLDWRSWASALCLGKAAGGAGATCSPSAARSALQFIF